LDEYVFALRTSTPCNLDRVAAKLLKPAGRKLGIEPLSWHDLRHSFCTLGRHEGIAPEVMQRLMRHTDIRTTLEIYSHVTENGAAELIEGSNVLPASCYPKPEAQSIQ
jgi:site-specific recombinase XerD